MNDQNNAHADLKDRIQNVIASSCEEWGLDACDIVGVLECVKHDFLFEVDRQDDDDEGIL